MQLPSILPHIVVGGSHLHALKGNTGALVEALQLANRAGNAHSFCQESTTQHLVNRKSVFLHQTSGSHPFMRHFSDIKRNETPRILVASWEYTCPPRSRPDFTCVSVAQHSPPEDLPDQITDGARHSSSALCWHCED
jgi:hypothetical protein